MQPPARRETSEVAKFGHYGATRRDETRLFPVGSRAQHSSSCGGVAAPFLCPSGQMVCLRIIVFSSIVVVDVLGMVSIWSPFFDDDRTLQ
jgi:hypothetical protein